MRISRLVVFILSSIGAKALTAQPPPDRTIAGIPVYTHESDAISVRSSSNGKKVWMLATKSSVSDAQVHAICAEASNCTAEGHPDEGGVGFLAVEAADDELESIATKHKDELEFIEADSLSELYPVDVHPDDTLTEVHQQTDGPTDRWGLDRIDDRKGLDESYVAPGDGSGVHVYVVDTGIRYTHEDFEGRAVPAMDISTGSIKNCTGQSNCAVDRQGHGSHCAGSVGGVNSGVAKNTFLHGVKITDGGMFSTAWIVMSIDWVVANVKARQTVPAVLSMSLGGPGPSPTTYAAVDKATAAGITVVVAAGNCRYNRFTGECPTIDACGISPAYVPNAITVGATDPPKNGGPDERAIYSHWGKCIDLMAPGTSIKSASPQGDYKYALMSGTSMACPHVSGAAALLISRNPTMSPAAVSKQLVEDASPIQMTSPMDSPQKLLYTAEAPTPAPTVPPTSPSDTERRRRRRATRRRRRRAESRRRTRRRRRRSEEQRRRRRRRRA